MHNNKVTQIASCHRLQAAPVGTEPKPFKLSTDIRAEWDERIKPEHAKLSTDELCLRQAEQEREALRVRLSASGDNFRRALAAGSGGAEAAAKKGAQVGRRGRCALRFCFLALYAAVAGLL